MITESKEVDKIEIASAFSILQVRTATVVRKDGEEMARSYHRHIVCPGDDLTNEDPRVVALANLLHTPELTAEFIAHRDAELARIAEQAGG